MSEGTCRIRVRVGDIEVEVEGTESYVQEKFTELQDRFLSPNLVETELKAARERKADAVRRPPPSEGPTLEEFHKERSYKNEPQRATTFVFWLTKFGGFSEAGIADVEECYEELGLPKPDVRVALHNAQYRHRWLRRGEGTKTYTANLAGKKLVLEELISQSG